MSLVVLQHDPLDPPARLGACLRDHGHRLDIRELHEGDQLPVDLDDVDGLVVMGGTMNVTDVGADAAPWINEELAFIDQAVAAGLPVVGICLGAQLIAKALGGEVEPMDAPEFGFADIKLGFPGTVDSILAGQPWETPQFHAHAQQITKLPAGAVPLAGSKACRTQAFCINRPSGPAHVYGFQYHFEWSRTDIRNFINGSGPWLAEHQIDPAPVLDSLDQYMTRYTQQGDRLAKRLADLLFAIDKRLSHTSGPVSSFDPAVS